MHEARAHGQDLIPVADQLGQLFLSISLADNVICQ